MILVDAVDGRPKGGWSRGPFHRLPETVERVTLVMQSASSHWRVCDEGWGLEVDPLVEKGDNAEGDPNSLRRQRGFAGVAAACRAREVEIVGLETMADMGDDESLERGKSQIRWIMRQKLVERLGLSQEAAEERSDRLIFTSA